VQPHTPLSSRGARSANPGPICGRPPWHKSFVRFDRIACIHMSGLLMRLVRPLAKMVFATRVPITHATLFGQWVPRIYSHLERSIAPSPLLLQLRFGRWGYPAGRPNLSITRQRPFGPRFAPQAACSRIALPSSSASRRCAPFCWPTPLPPASVFCASKARSASSAHELSIWLS